MFEYGGGRHSTPLYLKIATHFLCKFLIDKDARLILSPLVVNLYFQFFGLFGE